jgi:hypothetical protein
MVQELHKGNNHVHKSQFCETDKWSFSLYSKASKKVKLEFSNPFLSVSSMKKDYKCVTFIWYNLKFHPVAMFETVNI